MLHRRQELERRLFGSGRDVVLDTRKVSAHERSELVRGDQRGDGHGVPEVDGEGENDGGEDGAA